jgi:hypothetical protein
VVTVNLIVIIYKMIGKLIRKHKLR